jgi:L-alanine-DL-glutamate epimerase-like enolase superfamily enzyme
VETLFLGGFSGRGRRQRRHSAIDIAPWDIKGKASASGYERRRLGATIASYTHVGGATVPELVDSARALDDG